MGVFAFLFKLVADLYLHVVSLFPHLLKLVAVCVICISMLSIPSSLFQTGCGLYNLYLNAVCVFPRFLKIGCGLCDLYLNVFFVYFLTFLNWLRFM